ncbi:MAG: Fe-S cluster assembly protein SufD [Gemmatimonadota bacterium]|nr:Fe-S cluster assembly protein SufD [Gemmatimonadota bacterium]MDH3427061.1 Fe-S cluster assembly protein SufD [Gemmatimonadota bacterium]
MTRTETVGGPELLAEKRQAAWEEYRSLPMPTRKSEEWRYTDLRKLDPEAFEQLIDSTGGSVGALASDDIPGAVRDVLSESATRGGTMIEIDGAVGRLELDARAAEAGVVFGPIAQVAMERPELLDRFLFSSDVAPMERKLWSLHVAALSGGYVLHVPQNVRIDDPVHVVRWLSRAGVMVSTHSLIIVERGAQVTVIDEFMSADLDGEALSLNGVEVFGGDGSLVNYLALQRFGAGVKHFSMQHANTPRDCTLNSFNVSLGADLARCDVTSHLLGPGSDSEMLALWFGGRHQHFDYHTLQHHAAPHARSDLLFKGALTDSAKSVFRGLIRVDKGAQLTDAYQTNRNLLLSDDSQATTLPSLEIAADDVKCSHGATVGQVDAHQLFYLTSRGLTRAQAERLLVFGFFGEVLARMPVDSVRERMTDAIERKIGI